MNGSKLPSKARFVVFAAFSGLTSLTPSLASATTPLDTAFTDYALDDKLEVSRAKQGNAGETKADAAKSADAERLSERLARSDERWEKVDRRAMRTFQIASTVTVTGYALQGLGNITDSDAVELTGGMLSSLVGEPTMFGSAMRARRALIERGADVSGVAGYSAWGLWGGAFVVGIVGAANDEPNGGPLSLTSTAMELGALVSTTVQTSVNAKARAQFGSEPTSQTNLRQGEQGLVLTGVDMSPLRGGARVGVSGSF